MAYAHAMPFLPILGAEKAAPFKVLAATSEILRPARVEPVKLTRSTSGCAAMT